MEEIKTLLKSLEKEGLYEGKVLFEETEYLFLDGLVSVNPAIDMKGLSQDKKEERLKRMREKHNWQETRVVDTIEAYEKYLDMYPDSEYTDPAQDRLSFLKKDLNVWQQTQDVDSVPAYEFYLRDYPEGHYIDAAKERREFLKEADAAWKSAQNSNTIKEYKLFIEKYPDCNLTHSARKSIIALEDENKAWAEAEKKNTIDAYNAYLKNYPAGLSRDKATKKIEILEEEKRKAEQRLHEERSAWKEAEASDTIDSYQSYLDKYEDGQFVAAASERIKCLEKDNTAWQLACQKNTMGSYNRYIRKYPGGKHIETALKNLEILRKEEQQTKLNREEEIPYENGPKDRRLFKVAVVASIFIIAALIVIVSNNGGESTKVDNGNMTTEPKIEQPFKNGKPGDQRPGAINTNETSKKPQTGKNENKATDKEKVNDSTKENNIKSDERSSSIKTNPGEKFKPVINNEVKTEGKQENKNRVTPKDNPKEKIGEKNEKIIQEPPTPEVFEIVPKPEEEIQSLKFLILPKELRTKYLEKLSSIKIPDFEQEITVKGQISIILKVDDKGKISIQDFDDRYLVVTFESKKAAIKNSICTTITSIDLTPPTDSMRRPVIVQDWRLTYRIGTFKSNIILTIIF